MFLPVLCHVLGYPLFDDIIATDIDECAEYNDDCEHNCTNTNGSYYCTCDENYTLDEDGRNCTKHTICDNILCIAWDNPIKAVVIIVIKAVVIIVLLPGENTVSGFNS